MKAIIKLGDKVEILTDIKADGQQNKYYSNVQEISKTGEITIMAPIEGGKIIPLEMEKDYGMCVYTSKGLYRCEVIVISRSKEDKLYLITLVIKTSLQKYQRRQFYRLKCMLTFQYKDDEESDWKEGTIVDISGGGIRFTSDMALINKKGIVTHTRFAYKGDEKELYLPGVVVESTKNEINRLVYDNRIKFDEISSESREFIIQYIFEEERRRRKGEKGV